MAQATIGAVILGRLRAAAPDAAAATGAAGLSWLVARALLGHPQPLFPAVAAIVCLAPDMPNHGRQAAGLILGVATGIAVGEGALLVLDVFPALRLMFATFVGIMVASAYGLLPVAPAFRRCWRWRSARRRPARCGCSTSPAAPPSGLSSARRSSLLIR